MAKLIEDRVIDGSRHISEFGKSILLHQKHLDGFQHYSLEITECPFSVFIEVPLDQDQPIARDVVAALCTVVRGRECLPQKLVLSHASKRMYQNGVRALNNL